MARSLLVLSTVALMAIISQAADDTTSNSDSMWSDSSSQAPTNPFPPVVGCMVKTTVGGKPVTVDLADVARGANVEATSGDFSFTFSPCQQRALADCANENGKSVSVEGNLVIKNKDTCTAAADVYTQAAQDAVTYDTINSQWTVNLNNGVNNFQVMITCDPNAETTQVTNFDQDKRTLTLADYRVCAQDDSALEPVTVTEGCSADFSSFNRPMTSTLTGFQQWFDQQVSTTGNGLPDIRVQSCTAAAFSETTGPVKGCNGNGFFAFTNAANQCVVLEQRSVVFLPENQTFTSRYFNNAATGRGFAAQNLAAEEDAKTVQVSCGPENSYVSADSNGNFYAFTSPTVCGTARSAAPTTAPQAEEKKGLSAGAIAGIIIGVIAVIVLIAVGIVCFRSKSRSANEDGEYNRV